MLAGLVSPEAPLLLFLHTVIRLRVWVQDISLCIQISSSYQDTSQIRAHANLAHWNPISKYNYIWGTRGKGFSIKSSEGYNSTRHLPAVCHTFFLFFFGKRAISSVQSLSRVRFFATPWIAAHQASLSITNSQSSLKLTSIESVMPSWHLILCHPLLLLPPIPPSIRVFSNESTLCMRWPKYWSFSFNISPSNEHPGLISFKMDWLDLLAVQGTLKSLLQHHSSKASILRCSAFFTV